MAKGFKTDSDIKMEEVSEEMYEKPYYKIKKLKASQAIAIRQKVSHTVIASEHPGLKVLWYPKLKIMVFSGCNFPETGKQMNQNNFFDWEVEF